MEVEGFTWLRCEAHLRILSLDRMRKAQELAAQKRKRQFVSKECKSASTALKPNRQPKKTQKAPRASFTPKLKEETKGFLILIFKTKGK